jgi:hypothetical protein
LGCILLDWNGLERLFPNRNAILIGELGSPIGSSDSSIRDSGVPKAVTTRFILDHLYFIKNGLYSDPAVISAKVTGDVSSADLSTGGDVDHQVAACSAQPNNVPNGYGSPGVFPNAQGWATTTDAHMFNGPAGTW